MIIMLITITGCVKTTTGYADEYPADFEIYYSYGVGEKNILDTASNLYVKDMICDSSKEYTWKLTDSEMSQIFWAISDNDLWDIKDNFTDNCNGDNCLVVTPLSTTTLRISYDGRTKIVHWSGQYYSTQDPESKKLQNVMVTIQTVIAQKELELNIEQPTCGYI